MISSVPLLAPRDAHSLWYTPSRSFALTPPSSATPSLSNSGAAQNLNLNELHQSRQNQNQQKRTHISPLAQLALDEQQVEQRKLHIQRFGATWIRPPGFHKTLQGELDERAERAEAERVALLEEQAGGEEEVIDTGGDEDEHAGMDGNVMQGGEDVEDLDAQIPEGESYEGEDEGTEDEAVDLDEEIPEAEADYDLSDELDESEDESDEVQERATPALSNPRYMRPPNRIPSSSVGIRTDSSPRQAMFSHDDRFGQDESFGRDDMREYSRRYQSEAMSEDDEEMEVDSSDG
ncbi:Apc15p protein-domain-containing protein [Peziza echinospora]|nr:Apc15p protein-domain-containing protein [Peziza echinospora]